MGKVFKRLPSPSMAVAFIALLAALTGTAVALPGSNTVTSGDIVKNGVRSSDIKGSNVGSSDVKNNALTGSDVDESKLGQVPSAAAADTATSATTANSATSATTAATAATAANATAISDNTVTSTKVVNGSLNGDDVSRVSGSFVLNMGNVPANTCLQTVEDTGTGADMRNDAIIVTPEDTWPTNLNLSTENSTAIGRVRLNACNPTGADINPPSLTYRFIAFDVVP